MNTSIQIFNEQYVAASDTDLGTITSPPIPAQGNKAVVAVTVINLASSVGTNKLKVKLQGSYDGLAWSDLIDDPDLEFTGFAYGDHAKSDLDVAWVRLLAEGHDIGTSETLKAVFDAYIAFSEQ